MAPIWLDIFGTQSKELFFCLSTKINAILLGMEPRIMPFFLKMLFVGLIALSVTAYAFAQQQAADELKGGAIFKDSMRTATELQIKKTWKRSLLLPGLGQYTNGGLWWLKVPVIYGGFIAGIWAVDWNHDNYRAYLEEAQYRVKYHDAAPLNTNYPRANAQMTQAFINGKDYYRRNRDLMILTTVGWYALNAVEAYVSSMFKYRWNVDNDVSVRVSPAAQPVWNETAIGLRVAVTLP